MTNTTAEYRQHIIAAIRITGPQPVDITTHGGGPGAEGSYISAAFGRQLMITMYDLAAAKVYIRAWTAEGHQWIFKVLPATVAAAADTDEANIGPALSVRAYGHDRRDARYDQATRSALVRVGSLTWSVRDQAAADSMREAWRYLAEIAPLVLGRQASTRRR